MKLKEIEKILDTIPEFLKKEDTLKFYNSLKPVYKYLATILEEDKGMSNMDKAHDDYLDFIGFRLLKARNNLNDTEFRNILKLERFRALNAPTTRNLIKLTKEMTGFYPAEVYNYPNGEAASQYIKFITPYQTDLSKFPNLNDVCDAGARIYQEIKSKAERLRHSAKFQAGIIQLNKGIENIEVPTGGSKNDKKSY